MADHQQPRKPGDPNDARTTGGRDPARTEERRSSPSSGEYARRGHPAAESDPRDPYTGRFASAIRRISWGAIFAGAVVALVIQLMLNLLGLSIGLGAINPATEQNPLGGLGTGAGIWLGVTSIIALFAGGWTAGRLAGLPRRVDGILHGFVAWALATFVTFYLVTSGVGTVLSGAFNVVEQGTQLVASGVEAVAPQAGEAIGQISTDQVREEAMTILRQTGQEELQPENLSQRIDEAAETAGEAAGEAAQTPADAQQEIEQALNSLISSGEEVVSAADREAAVNVLVTRTDMTEQEARNTVRQYEEVFAQARQQIGETAEQVQEQTPEIAGDVADTVSSAALWAFIAMLVGALSAAGGGAVGAPRDMPASPAVRRE